MSQPSRTARSVSNEIGVARNRATARRITDAQATRRQRRLSQGASAVDRGSSAASMRERLNPTQCFGHKGIERRVQALRRNVDLVFPDDRGGDTEEPGDATGRAVEEHSRAVAVSATMPAADRRRARARIDAELTRLENALVDLLLPPG